MSVRPSSHPRKAANPQGDVATPMRRGRLSYANVTASLALFVALGGTSYAAIKLPANSVGTIQLKSRAVAKAKIAPGAVDGSKLRDGSVTSADIAPGAVDGSKLRDGAVTGAEIAPGAVDGSKVRDGSLTGADILGKVPGAVTADMLAHVQRIAVASASDPAPDSSFSTKATTAACPAGTFVVGGGASLGDQNAQIVKDSYPSSTTSWTANVDNFEPTAPGFTVYAICAPAAAAS